MKLLKLLLLAETSLCCLVELHFFPIFQLDTADMSSSLQYFPALTDPLCSVGGLSKNLEFVSASVIEM